MRFGTKLAFIMILIGAVPLLLGGLFLFTFFDRYLSEKVGSNLEEVALLKSAELTGLLNQRIALSERFASSVEDVTGETKPPILKIEREGDLAGWEEEVATLYRHYELFFKNVSIINKDKEVLFSSHDDAFFEDLSFWTDLAFERKETVVSDVFFRDGSGIIGVFTTIKDKDNDPLLLVAEIADYDFFGTLNIDTSDSRDIFLLNNRGLVIFSDRDNLQHKAIDQTYPFGVATGIKKGSVVFQVEEERLIGGFSVIPGLGWHIIVTRGEGEALLFLAEMARNYVFLAAMLVALIILISFFISKKVIRPLKNISLASQRVAKGDFDVKASVTSADEFGDLADNFNKMTEDLKTAQKKIEEEKQILEVKVMARTKMLKELNENLEDKVRKRTEDMEKKIMDLEKMSRLMVGRELKMVEMKKEMKKIEEDLEEEHKKTTKNE